MKNYTRFIPGEEIEAVEQWRFGAIDTAAQLLADRQRAIALADAEAQKQASEQQAYQAGFDAGMAQGTTRGSAQGRAQVQVETRRQMDDFMANMARQTGDQLAAMLSAAQSRVVEAEQAMAQDVLELACELARQVLRRELSIDPHAVLPVLREALGLLGLQHKSAVVRLHPTDAQMLKEIVHDAFAGMSLTLVSDAAVLPGGCLVESSGTVVDGTVSKRWQRAVANLGLNTAWDTPHDAAQDIHQDAHHDNPV